MELAQVADDAWLEHGCLEGGGADQHVLFAHDGSDLIGCIQSVLEREQAGVRGKDVFGGLRGLVEVVGLHREQDQVGLTKIARVV